uniref:Uncharacterized protein n=1 Tax=Romanomermis culicivorax TaxID=13658 RepID=A0A915IDV1_ROMCU
MKIRLAEQPNSLAPSDISGLERSYSINTYSFFTGDRLAFEVTVTRSPKYLSNRDLTTQRSERWIDDYE